MKKHFYTKRTLLFGFFSIFVINTYAQGTPYCPCIVSGFLYRAPIVITNTAGVNLIDYQISINVTYNANMNPDFSDLTFRDASCTDLSYWIETPIIASTSATVWIKIPSIPISGATIYMYYGNPTATTASNGANTFVVFSGFESGTSEGVSVYDEYGWCNNDPSLNTSVSSSIFNSGFNTTSICGAYIKTGKVIPSSLTGNYVCGVRANSSFQAHDPPCGTQMPTFYCGAASAVMTYNVWNRLEINSNSPGGGYISTSCTIGFCGCGLCDCGSSSGIDFLYIRKRSSPEPGSTVGLEENDSALSVSISSTQGGCIGNDGTTTANPSNGIAPYSYIWNNGQINQTATGLVSGTYSVTATDANGCTSTNSVTITVNQPFSTNNPQTICNGQSYSINSHIYTIAGTYHDTLTTVSGCDSIIVTQLTVNSVYNTNNPQTICNGQSYSINSHIYTTAGTYYDTIATVSGCDSIIVTQLTVNPVFNTNNPQMICNGQSYSINSHIYTTAGTYYDTIATITTCDSIIVTILSVAPNPSVAESHTDAHCSGSNGTATATPTGGASPYTYSWTGGQTTQIATGLASGTYTVTVTDTNGCTQTQTVTINSIPVPTATASAAPSTITLGNNTQLNSTGGGIYQWLPVTGLSCVNCANPIATPLLTTTYCVIVTDSNSCTDSACVTIVVDIICGEIFVPTAFSPNKDGQNEIECVYNNCIKTLNFAIYDRWGEKVFETTDAKECWDGTYKGKPLNTGAFVYYMKATLYNGTEITKQGNISLLR